MVPSNFTQIFGTMFVGICAIAAVLLIGWVLSPTITYDESPPKRLLREIGAQGVFGGFVALLVAYGIGVVAEGITDHLTDVDTDSCEHPRQGVAETFSCMQRDWLGGEDYHRLLSVYHLDRTPATPNSLGRSLLREREYLLSHIDPTDPDHRNFAYGGAAACVSNETRDLCASEEVASEIVNAMYYTAKNWTYQQPTYFAELEGLQRRIDWSRSLFLISTWIIPVALLLVSVKLALWMVLRIAWLARPRLRPENVNDFMLSGVAVDRLNVLLIVALGIAYFSRIAHHQSELQFNERAFGYYASHLDASQATSVSDRLRLDGSLWVQTSGEYHALARQTYATATAEILSRLPSRAPGGRPLAVVLDLDETVIDNGFYNYERAVRGEGFDPDSWDQWLRLHIDDMEAVPGAREFIAAMRAVDIAVIFISNRPASRERETWEALAAVAGVEQAPGVEMYLQDGGSDKSLRRAAVLATYDVVGWIGDQLSDFPFEDLAPDPEARWANVCSPEFLSQFGTMWFLLPNPIYGNWLDLLDPGSSIRYYRSDNFSADCG